MSEYKDYMIRATAVDGAVRAFAATSRDLVDEAMKRHGTTPVATAALGRLMTAGVMMGSMMKNEDDLITVQIHSDGPIGAIIVTADNQGHVKGYVNNPNVVLPPKSNGHLDVSGAVGRGTLQVIRDTGLKNPWVGTIDLVSGEIAEDITYYFASSEQIPSAVALGVLVGNGYVMQAGGFIIQLMPFASEEVISALENKLAKIPSVTTMLRQGMTPEDMLNFVLGDLGELEFTEKMPISFQCNCSKERVEAAVISVGRSELQDMINEGKTIEVCCHFCGEKYHYTVDELKEMLAKASRP